jgi:hypothetical protein
MLLQGSAGTSKTHTLRVILAVLKEMNIPHLICTTTRIVGVQYSGGQTVHSLFSFGISEDQTSFISHIGSRSTKAKYLQDARIIVIDNVSMLTLWVTREFR